MRAGVLLTRLTLTQLIYLDMRFFTYLFLFTFTLPVLSSSTKTVLIAGDNWCPVNCGANDENKGFMIDVATEALKYSGYEVRYIEMPWVRAIHQAREGKIHAIVGAFQDDAPDFYFPKVPFLKMSPNTLFTLKSNNWSYKNLKSLNNVRLGAVQGYDYGNLLNAYLRPQLNTPNSDITLLSGDNVVRRGIRLLINKRIDVYVDAGPVVWYQAKQMKINKQLKTAGSISEFEPVYIAFSPKSDDNEKLKLALDMGVLMLQREGRIAEIADKYGLGEEYYK